MKNNNTNLFTVIKSAFLLICTLLFGISTVSVISATSYLGFNFFLNNLDAPLSAALCIANLILTILPFIRKRPNNKNIAIISLVFSVIVFLPSLIHNILYIYTTTNINIILFIKGILSAAVVIISIPEFLHFNSESGNKKKAMPTANNCIEKLVEYKELLDTGIITQEEFEEKKKALLNQ